MKNKLRVISFLLCITLYFPIFAACSAKVLTYTGAALNQAKVGEFYICSVATADCGEDSEGITYELKSGSTLPIGLFLSEDGELSGTPRAKTAAAVSFTIVASAEGYDSAEADFSITIQEGTLSYEGKDDLRARVGTPANIDIASAAGTTGTITYSLKSGDTLPEGLTLSSSGKITGTADEEAETTFTVIVTATDCTAAEAEFTIITGSWLDYTGKTLPSGNVGKFYSETIATASGTERAITYTLKDGGELPAGLSLTDGLILGSPSATGRKTFVIIAAANGLDPAEATFSINILPPDDDEFEDGTITYQGKTLSEGYIGTAYDKMTVAGAGTATADNGATVSYALESGSVLPDGLTLLVNGSIIGTPTTTVSAHTFTVVASANGCDPVTATFTVTISAARLRFPAGGLLLPDGKKGTPYSRSLATAYASNGVEGVDITYSVKPPKSLPAGLTLSAQGLLSGTPTKISKIYSFAIIAEADGYISAENQIVLTVNDSVHTGVTRFEAEYTYLEGIQGAGFSGGSTGTGLIGDPAGASNDAAIVFTHGMTSPITFNISSSATVSGVSFWVGLASEIGTVDLNNNSFDIRINGQSIPYSIHLPGLGGNLFGEFGRYLVSSNVTLPAGNFTVELEVMQGNTLVAGVKEGGPAMDYIEFENLGNAVLSWTPWTLNLLSDGEEGM